MAMALILCTLRKRSDFVRLRRGRKAVTPFFVVRAAQSDLPDTNLARVGYTVTTKCGNAVVRNRVKRRLRALVAELFPAHAKAGYDYVVIALDNAQPSAAHASFADLRAAMQQAMRVVHP